MSQTVIPCLLRVCRSVDAFRRLLFLLVLGALAASATAATGASTRHFNLARGDAAGESAEAEAEEDWLDEGPAEEWDW